MDLKTFKKRLNDIFIQEGLFKKGSYYYQTRQDVICVIGLQKSNFSQSYYINIGYVIRSIHTNIENPRDVDGDIRSRFSIVVEGKEIDSFSFENLREEDLKKYILQNIESFVKPASSIEGLKSILNRNPEMLYQTKLTAKGILGYA